jgi:hypothetical protein
MRIPIFLAIAVIVLTPANIREVTADAFAQVQTTVSHWLGGKDRTKVAAVKAVDTSAAAQQN